MFLKMLNILQKDTNLVGNILAINFGFVLPQSLEYYFTKHCIKAVW